MSVLAAGTHQQIVQHAAGGDARCSSDAFPLRGDGALVAARRLHLLHVDHVRRQGVVASLFGRRGEQLRLELLRKLSAALLQIADLLLLFPQAHLRFGG